MTTQRALWEWELEIALIAVKAIKAAEDGMNAAIKNGGITLRGLIAVEHDGEIIGFLEPSDIEEWAYRTAS